uniref:Uncharacterized protein n=1 Tax=Ciona intestinalis TaxID=7719 RepID=H2XUS0_CIOIN
MNRTSKLWYDSIHLSDEGLSHMLKQIEGQLLNDQKVQVRIKSEFESNAARQTEKTSQTGKLRFPSLLQYSNIQFYIFLINSDCSNVCFCCKN